MIPILILFIFVGVAVKLSFWKWWQALLFGIICALFTVFICQYAILQSKTQLADYLSNKRVMENIAVLVTIEAVLCFAFVFTELFGDGAGCVSAGAGNLGVGGASVGGVLRAGLRNVLRVDLCGVLRAGLRAYPSVLIFPALFYILAQAIYFFAGVNFENISYYVALGVGIGLPLFSLLLKFLCPDKEFRLEIYLLVSVFICIVGLISTANSDIIYMKI